MTARIAPSLTLHLKMLMVIITQDQCDQMLDQKNAQMFSKVAQKYPQQFLNQLIFFKIAQKVSQQSFLATFGS